MTAHALASVVEAADFPEWVTYCTCGWDSEPDCTYKGALREFDIHILEQSGASESAPDEPEAGS